MKKRHLLYQRNKHDLVMKTMRSNQHIMVVLLGTLLRGGLRSREKTTHDSYFVIVIFVVINSLYAKKCFKIRISNSV